MCDFPQKQNAIGLTNATLKGAAGTIYRSYYKKNTLKDIDNAQPRTKKGIAMTGHDNEEWVCPECCGK